MSLRRKGWKKGVEGEGEKVGRGKERRSVMLKCTAMRLALG